MNADHRPGAVQQQLSFEQLGTPLSEVTFVVVDLETTGGRADGDAITEFGAVKVRGGVLLASSAHWSTRSAASRRRWWR